jgi:hypothetical protein
MLCGKYWHAAEDWFENNENRTSPCVEDRLAVNMRDTEGQILQILATEPTKGVAGATKM